MAYLTGVSTGKRLDQANYADMVICSTNARFKYPFSTLGLTPELGSSQLIPFIVGMAKAKEIMMLVSPPCKIHTLCIGCVLQGAGCVHIYL